MRHTAFSRRLLASLVVLGVLGCRAQAQFIGAGSTPQGDYLRGAGIAAMGMGIYNEKTAIAELDQPRHHDSLRMNTWRPWPTSRERSTSSAACISQRETRR